MNKIQKNISILLVCSIASFSMVQLAYAPSPPIANSIGIITTNLMSQGCVEGFYGHFGGTCSSNVNDMPIGFEIPIPSSGHLQNLFIVMTDYDHSYYQVYINNQPTDMGCTMSGSSLDCNDVTHSIPVNAGDHLMIKVDNPDDPYCGGTATMLLTT